METVDLKRLLIVDGHAYAYRAYHAIRHLQSPDGAPTNAIYGFIKMMDRMRAYVRPTHMVVVWDGGLADERVAEHPEYKAQRPPMPDSLESQIEEVVSYLAAAGITSLRAEKVEADDWIGTLAREAASRMEVIIASSDKDFMQIVSERVGLLNPGDKVERIWGSAEVIAKTGVRPEQVVDWLSLIGDAVDNIPGVPGVGPKTATDLLRQFETIDGIYRNLGSIKSERLRRALEEGQEAVLRNLRLIGLRPAGVAMEVERLRLRDPDHGKLRDYYARWGFKTMVAELKARGMVQQALF